MHLRLIIGGLVRVLPFLGAALTLPFKNKKVKKYLPHILTGVAGFYVLKYFTDNQKSLADISEESNDSKRATMVAELLTEYLGTNKNFSWYQVSTWTEDEESAVQLILDNLHIITLVESEYNAISKSGSLRDDLSRYLDEDQKKELFGKI
ncbi:hypothetical protein [Flexithrix dorotheae]|uniref:hypothetical protein n=1 Tax=Flexithrix dorotheae TaxID=70993 RepID=UPI0012FB7C6A|nr:hypothetical protein [Flexithrix dorotheae]